MDHATREHQYDRERPPARPGVHRTRRGARPEPGDRAPCRPEGRGGPRPTHRRTSHRARATPIRWADTRGNGALLGGTGVVQAGGVRGFALIARGRYRRADHLGTRKPHDASARAQRRSGVDCCGRCGLGGPGLWRRHALTAPVNPVSAGCSALCLANFHTIRSRNSQQRGRRP